ICRLRNEESSMNVLIAGCGYVGSALALQLLSEGHSVWGLRRNVAALPDGVHPLQADLHQDPFVVLPVPFDQVVYATGSEAFTEAAYRAAYVDGPRRLITALQEQGQAPQRVIFTSSTGV